MKLIIVSGRSGSGKSVALRVLEDLGYYCVDNIPINLLPALTHTVINDYETVAVSLDVRNLPNDPKDIPEIIKVYTVENTCIPIYCNLNVKSAINPYKQAKSAISFIKATYFMCNSNCQLLC